MAGVCSSSVVCAVKTGWCFLRRVHVFGILASGIPATTTMLRVAVFGGFGTPARGILESGIPITTTMLRVPVLIMFGC